MLFIFYILYFHWGGCTEYSNKTSYWITLFVCLLAHTTAPRTLVVMAQTDGETVPLPGLIPFVSMTTKIPPSNMQTLTHPYGENTQRHLIKLS